MNKTKVMVVEDEHIVALDIRAFLTELGYAVPAIARSGQEAMRAAEEVSPDLVLMDVRLQGDMDGVEVASRIRAMLDIPVVFLTAYASQDILERAKISEPFGYLIKPFQERELYTTVEMALYKHRAERSLRQYAGQLERANRELALTNWLAQLPPQVQDPQSIVDDTCCELADILDVPRALVVRREPALDQSVTVAEYEVHSQPATLQHYLTSESDPLTRFLLAQRRTLVVSDVQRDPRVEPIRGWLRWRGTMSFLAIPLIARESVLGVVGLEAGESSFFPGENVRLADSICRQLVRALDDARLAEKRQEAREFSASIVHDLNNLLCTINGFATLISKQTLPDARLSAFAGHILDSGTRATELVAQLLPDGPHRGTEAEKGLASEPFQPIQMTRGIRAGLNG